MNRHSLPGRKHRYAVALAAVLVFSGIHVPANAAGVAEKASAQAESTRAAVPDRIRLPRRVPRNVRSGRMKTPLGPARWVLVQGDATEVPEYLNDRVAVPGGWAIAEYADRERETRLWFSPDLVRWRTRPLPMDPSLVTRIFQAGDAWWLVSMPESFRDGKSVEIDATLWRSADVRTWQPVDLGMLTPPAPAKLEWETRLGPVVGGTGVTAALVIHRLKRAGAVLGLASQFHDYARLSTTPQDHYEVHDGWGTHIADLRFEQGGSGLHVIEDLSGEQLATIEGADQDFIDRWAASGVLVEYQLGIIEDGSMRYGRLPPMAAGSEIVLGSEDGGIRAIVTPPEGHFRTFWTADGESWETGPLLGDDPGEPSGPDGISVTHDGRWYSWGRGQELSSDDGLAWEDLDPHRLGAGRLEWRNGAGLFYYPEGGDPPLRISTEPLRIPQDRCRTGGGGSAGRGMLADGIYRSSKTYNGGAGCRSHLLIQFDRFVR